MLCVQQTTLSVLIGEVSATYFNNLAFTTAARSSSLGSGTVLISATLDLDVTSRIHLTLLIGYLNVHCSSAFAFGEASSKPCSSILQSGVTPFPKQRGMLTSFNCNKSDLLGDHFSLVSLSSGSSH